MSAGSKANSDECKRRTKSLIETTQLGKERGEISVTFYHEPEERLALLDTSFYQNILNEEMTDLTEATNDIHKETELISDRTIENEARKEQTTVMFDKENTADKPSDAIHKYCSAHTRRSFAMDVDVLNSVSAHPQDSLKLNQTTPFPSKLDLPLVEGNRAGDQKIKADGENRGQYWSDEEAGRYPPQMSLSPVIGRTMLRKASHHKKTSINDKKRDSLNRVYAGRKQSVGATKTHQALVQHKKVTRLNPLITKSTDCYQVKNSIVQSSTTKISPDVTKLIHNQKNKNNAGHYILSGSNSAPTGMKNIEKSDIRNTNESSNLSPSLVRPILNTTSPTKPPLKNFKDSNKRKNDVLFYSQRVSLPTRRQVSRSKSTSTSNVPELPAISKTRRPSKSISDFRQSSSIFGKLVRKNGSKESVPESEKTSKGGTPNKDIKNSVSQNNETTRQKLSRILSFN